MMTHGFQRAGLPAPERSVSQIDSSSTLLLVAATKTALEMGHISRTPEGHSSPINGRGRECGWAACGLRLMG
jgi:hypothetical protein